MLQIRQDQLPLLVPSPPASFVATLVKLLHREFPDSVDVPVGELTATVKDLLLRAGSYGLVTEQQLGVFVAVAWVMGPDFDYEVPAAEEVLQDETLSADEKVAWLQEWTHAVFSALETPS